MGAIKMMLSGPRRLVRSIAILVIAALGLLLPATAAVSLTQSGGAAIAAPVGSGAAPSANVRAHPKGIFAPVKARSGERSYHSPAAEAEQVRSASVSGALGFWMLVGLALMLLAASLAPLRAGRKDCGRGRCRAC